MVKSAPKFALVYSDVKRTQDALKLEEAVLEIRRRNLDPEHPHLLDSMKNLASSYSEVGRTRDGLALMRKSQQSNPYSVLYTKFLQQLENKMLVKDRVHRDNGTHSNKSKRCGNFKDWLSNTWQK